MKSWKWVAALVAVLLAAIVILQGMGILSIGDSLMLLAIAVLLLGLVHTIPD